MSLTEVVAGAKALLLDFDGPVCSVFAGYPAPRIAEELRGLLTERGIHVSTKTDSPHALYACAATRHRELAAWLDDELTEREMEAVLSAAPTMGAQDVVDAALSADLAVAIVSNNAAAAIRRYLDVRGLGSSVPLVIGRPHADPERMKPHPALVDAAVSALGVASETALFVGDSTTDMEAAQRAGVRGIGYAKAPERRSGLAEAGAAEVIDSMSELAHALKAASA
jgi:HAD superfamily hydrolase (TIGR01549 family)